MKTFITIFRKELTDTIRDRRTLIVMIVIPLLLFPLMMALVTKVQASQIAKERGKILKVALITHGNAPQFRDQLMSRNDMRVEEAVPEDSIRALIQSERLDAAFVLDEDFDKKVDALQTGTMHVYFKSSEGFDIAKRRLLDIVHDYEKQLLTNRFQKLKLDQTIISTVKIEERDVASMQEKIGKTVGGFLPYIFVIFCFIGSMYPAIDLGAGEKERGTIETLLTTPVSRLQILIGKFAVVVLTGLLSAGVAILGLYVSVRQSADIPPALLDAIMGMLGFKSIALVLSLLLPLTVFFAGFLLSLSFFAKSYKEAQSIMSPLSFLVIVPVLIGLLPGIKLDTSTALIPVLNVSLATKEIIAGTISVGLLMEAYASLILLAALSLYACSKWFEREETIFRGS